MLTSSLLTSLFIVPYMFKWELGGKKVYLVLQELEGEVIKEKMIPKQTTFGDIVFETSMVSIKFKVIILNFYRCSPRATSIATITWWMERRDTILNSLLSALTTIRS